MSFTASHGRRCELLSTMPRVVILKLKLPMVVGHFCYAFAMMGRVFHPRFWNRAAPATTVCAECGNGPSKSAASWISGAEWAAVRRLNSASRPRLRMARRQAALSSTCSQESKVTCDPSFVGARRLAAVNLEGVRLIDNVLVTEIKTQRSLGRLWRPAHHHRFWSSSLCLLAPRCFKKAAARGRRVRSRFKRTERAEAGIKALKEHDPPIPEFMLFLIHPRHSNERRDVGPPFQPHPPEKPLAAMYRSMRGCLLGSHAARDGSRLKAARSRLPPSDVHDGRRPPFERRQ